MTERTPEYKLGDVANGHILTEQGWIPIPPPSPVSKKTEKAKKPFYKRWWVVAVAVVLAIGGISATAGASEDSPADRPDQVATQTLPKDEQSTGNQKSHDQPQEQGAGGTAEDSVPEKPAPEKPAAEEPVVEEPAVQERAVDEPAAEAQDEAPAETPGQENARESAEDYLEFGAFSRQGLIEQLEFEGYSTQDATYAVDAVAPDWQEQATKSAQEYLDTSAFSRSGLIEQLEFEGFTPQQAEYGVDDVAPDWNEQAAKSAQEYLDTSAFSRTGLIDQLTFEGFTPQQAEYGVNQTGL